jgi:hypothetical protein
MRGGLQEYDFLVFDNKKFKELYKYFKMECLLSIKTENSNYL